MNGDAAVGARVGLVHAVDASAWPPPPHGGSQQGSGPVPPKIFFPFLFLWITSNQDFFFVENEFHSIRRFLGMLGFGKGRDEGDRGGLGPGDELPCKAKRGEHRRAPQGGAVGKVRSASHLPS